MRAFKKVLSFAASMVVIALSVSILVIVSLVSMIFNSVLFILMVCGLSVPMFGNMLINMLPTKK